MSAAPDLKRVTLELGRQRPGHRARRRRPRHRRLGHLRRAFNNNGQVCSADQAGLRPRGPLRRRGRGAGDACPRHQGRRGHRGGREARPDQQRAPVRAGQGAGGRRPVARRDGGHGRQGHGPPRLLLRAHDPHRPLRRHPDRRRGAVRSGAAGRALPDLGDAIDRANATHFGLSGSVWSADPDRAADVAAQLECGTAWVNTHLALAPQQPFGGFKWSGIGVENGPWGLAEFSEFQVVHRSKAATGSTPTRPCCSRRPRPGRASVLPTRRGVDVTSAGRGRSSRVAAPAPWQTPLRRTCTMSCTSDRPFLIAASGRLVSRPGRREQVVVGVPLGRRVGEHGGGQPVGRTRGGADLVRSDRR